MAYSSEDGVSSCGGSELGLLHMEGTEGGCLTDLVSTRGGA